MTSNPSEPNVNALTVRRIETAELAHLGLTGQIEQSYEKSLKFLTNYRIPSHFLSFHPGPSGIVLTYVSHSALTELLNRLLGMSWEWKVESVQLMPDKSAVAICTLSVSIPLANGEIIKRSVTEVGQFEYRRDKNGNPAQSDAERIASAASRGLPRAAMRLFGIGRELYIESDIKKSLDDKMAMIEKLCQQNKVKFSIIKGRAKAKGVTEDTIENAFMWSLRCIHEAIMEEKGGVSNNETYNAMIQEAKLIIVEDEKKVKERKARPKAKKPDEVVDGKFTEIPKEQSLPAEKEKTVQPENSIVSAPEPVIEEQKTEDAKSPEIVEPEYVDLVPEEEQKKTRDPKAEARAKLQSITLENTENNNVEDWG